MIFSFADRSITYPLGKRIGYNLFNYYENICAKKCTVGSTKSKALKIIEFKGDDDLSERSSMILLFNRH